MRRENGTLAENGCGKMNDITDAGLERLRGMGVSHVWYTGIVRHATQTDYSAFGIPPCHPAVVKGRAGSPYAITDYYDIDPDLAVSVPDRMREFEALVARTHRAGLKVVMDFVPNHVLTTASTPATISITVRAARSPLTSVLSRQTAARLMRNIPPKPPATTISTRGRARTTGMRPSS